MEFKALETVSERPEKISFVTVKMLKFYSLPPGSQFRMEELILKFHLRGVALQYSGGFPTDVSECCVWLTPFVREQDSWGDIR